MDSITKIAEISVTYHPAIADKPVIISALDAYLQFIQFFPSETISLQERFMVMYLNRGNRCLGVFPAFVGGLTSTVVDLRIILSVGLKIAATQMMLCHSHPSGNLKPSNADIEITSRIKEACKILDIILLDHLIISPQGEYYSLAEQGLI